MSARTWHNLNAVEANETSLRHIPDTAGVCWKHPIGNDRASLQFDEIDFVPVGHRACVQLKPEHVHLGGLLTNVWAECAIPLRVVILAPALGTPRGRVQQAVLRKPVRSPPQIDEACVSGRAPTLDAHHGAHTSVLAYAYGRWVDKRLKLELDEFCVPMTGVGLCWIVREAQRRCHIVHGHWHGIGPVDYVTEAVPCQKPRAPSQCGIAIAKRI
eukprot:4419673-Prymnesium_polylepis.1